MRAYTDIPATAIPATGSRTAHKRRHLSKLIDLALLSISISICIKCGRLHKSCDRHKVLDNVLIAERAASCHMGRKACEVKLDRIKGDRVSYEERTQRIHIVRQTLIREIDLGLDTRITTRMIDNHLRIYTAHKDRIILGMRLVTRNKDRKEGVGHGFYTYLAGRRAAQFFSRRALYSFQLRRYNCRAHCLEQKRLTAQLIVERTRV